MRLIKMFLLLLIGCFSTLFSAAQLDTTKEILKEGTGLIYKIKKGNTEDRLFIIVKELNNSYALLNWQMLNAKTKGSITISAKAALSAKIFDHRFMEGNILLPDSVTNIVPSQDQKIEIIYSMMDWEEVGAKSHQYTETDYGINYPVRINGANQSLRVIRLADNKKTSRLVFAAYYDNKGNKIPEFLVECKGTAVEMTLESIRMQ